MKNSSTTRQITDGAILTAVFLVLALFTYYTPLFLLSFLILPTPFIIIFVRTSVKIFLLSVVAGVTILFTLVDPLYTISMGLTALVIGGALGYAFKVKWQANQVIFTGMAAVLFLFLSVFFLFQLILDIELLNEIVVVFHEAFQAQVETLENMGASEAQLEEAKELETFILENLVVFVPGALIAASILTGYLHTLINQRLLSRLGYFVSDLPAFQDWRFPVFLSWFYVIASLGLFFIVDLHGYWGMLMANLFILCNYMLLIQGLALIYWLLKAWKGLPKFLAVILLIIALVLPFVNLAIVILGIVDQFFNLRRVLTKKT